MERRQLRRVRIGDIPCVEHLGRARDFGERGADEPAGATFGERDAAARGLLGADHATRGLAAFRGRAGIQGSAPPLPTRWQESPEGQTDVSEGNPWWKPGDATNNSPREH